MGEKQCKKEALYDSSWKKIAKANNAWTSSIQSEQIYDKTLLNGKIEDCEERVSLEDVKTTASVITEVTSFVQDLDPLLIENSQVNKSNKRKRKKITMKTESSDERKLRLAKMSAYASQRLANETPQQRAVRLKRMSQYASKKLSMETTDQRAKRLARMSAYAAKRLAEESPEQRKARLARMSAYVSKKFTRRKISNNSENT